ncbi:hypothetical protein ANACAC_02898 [Anaerostipes caccae L1-92]|uniref:Uncharacterized protein n=1 Tax=Anaerostipes caccae (strain DSM 14662 / CCUG 47493 / JCM 13470 / NCIMB 13811 / L1-92) TaxID=411490 RepID=B0MHD6_ANACD|nr:hypothetical protein ANACAC_02898 [Anaerostipes caccae L1-92]
MYSLLSFSLCLFQEKVRYVKLSSVKQRKRRQYPMLPPLVLLFLLF